MECVVFTGEKKREGLGDASPRVLILTLARSSKEAFFSAFANNALRGLLENDVSRDECGSNFVILPFRAIDTIRISSRFLRKRAQARAYMYRGAFAAFGQSLHGT
ncbi:MAG: hypothetical protein HQL86_00915 [Magnetococcales bacterium]|nr:hypothetical protein [Magnetococcales bacterium]